MTITHIIMLIAITVSATVALIVASQQRKQMRQIELYKKDSSVGLMPPSSVLTRFIKSKWDAVLGFGGPIVGLTFEFMSSTPITRFTIILISLNIALLLANIVMAIIFRVVDQIFRTISRLTDIVEKNIGLHKDHFEITKSHTRVLEKQSSYEVEPPDGT